MRLKYPSQQFYDQDVCSNISISSFSSCPDISLVANLISGDHDATNLNKIYSLQINSNGDIDFQPITLAFVFNYHYDDLSVKIKKMDQDSEERVIV